MKKKMVKIIVLSLSFFVYNGLISQSFLSPEDYFGFQMGENRKLIDWEEIISYFTMLDENSERIKVKKLGESTLGKPFIMAVLSTRENLEKLSQFKKIQQALAHPYTITEQQADSLIKVGKTIVLVTLNIHSTEIGASQTSVEIAYELAGNSVNRDPDILKDVIVIMIPSVNPDGQQMVVDWYEKHVGTPYEGCRMPWLYHHYAGHDDNRDWFFFNLKETKLVGDILYKEWFPEIVYDQHQMGYSGARIFLPPYDDPVNPRVHPAAMAMTNMVGKHIVADLHTQGYQGILSGRTFNAYFEGTLSKTPLWHNMVGILCEMASVRIASPLYLPRGSLGKYGSELPAYSKANNFLDPWPGGWWRLRDIIEYEKSSIYSLLRLAGRQKQDFLENFYNLNRDAIKKGKTRPPFAYIIPQDQHDPNSAVEMLKRLQFNGVKIYRTESNFTYRKKEYPRSTFIIPLAQPCRPCIRDLMEPQNYPNLKEYPQGPPKRPYDYTGWTLPLLMGVEVKKMEELLDLDLQLIEKISTAPKSEINAEAEYFFFQRRFNHSYILINKLLHKGVRLFQLKYCGKESEEIFPEDAVFMDNKRGIHKELRKLSETFQVPIHSVCARINEGKIKLKPVRLGIYQSWLANMDEGWTRLVLDTFRFHYTPIHNQQIISGSLEKNYDAIIIPDMGTTSITDGTYRWSDSDRLGSPLIPEKYKGGIGEQGTRNLKSFVLQGGTLILLGSACDFGIEKLGIPASNVVKNLSSKQYYAPGALLEIKLDPDHHMTRGMKSRAVIRVTNSPAFDLNYYPEKIDAVGYYEDTNPLRSGWLIGWEKIAGKTVLAEIPAGRGRFIMFGFGVQKRAQTYGTFKLLFNSILSSTYE
ncbi:MAG: M14 family metallopeptidase [bacterium]